MSEKYLYCILEELNIIFERINHPAVYTNEQARELVLPSNGASAKNLFLRDRKGKRHFLIMLDDNKELDLGDLATQIGSTRLSFASPERLMKYLGIEPGAVSPLALINDTAHDVELWVDQALWNEEIILCHPLVNTATLALSTRDLNRFFEKTDHKINYIKI